MKGLWEKLKKHLTDDDVKRYLCFLALPFAAIILIAVIVVVDRPKSAGVGDSPPIIDESADIKESDGIQVQTAVISLQKDAVPEINQLMESYFKARKNCSISDLGVVFGDTYSTEELDEQQRKMEKEIKFYQDFQNLSCYTLPGIETDSYVVYAEFDIKFRQAETLAPTMVGCYVKKGDQGTYYLTAQTTEEESIYMEKMNQTDEVQAMAAEVNTELRMALESDENLLSVYHILMNQDETTDTSLPETMQ